MDNTDLTNTEKQEEVKGEIVPVSKHPGGRPRKYQTVEEMEKAIDEYFLHGMRKKKVVVGPPNNRRTEEIEVPTVTGLALWLGFTSRNALLAYEGYSEEFFGTLKKAKTFIEEHYEELMQTGNPAGPIFALKNFGWRDSHDFTSGGKPLKPPAVISFADFQAQQKKAEGGSDADAE